MTDIVERLDKSCWVTSIASSGYEYENDETLHKEAAEEILKLRAELVKGEGQLTTEEITHDPLQTAPHKPEFTLEEIAQLAEKHGCVVVPKDEERKDNSSISYNDFNAHPWR